MVCVSEAQVQLEVQVGLRAVNPGSRTNGQSRHWQSRLPRHSGCQAQDGTRDPASRGDRYTIQNHFKRNLSLSKRIVGPDLKGWQYKSPAEFTARVVTVRRSESFCSEFRVSQSSLPASRRRAQQKGPMARAVAFFAEIICDCL